MEPNDLMLIAHQIHFITCRKRLYNVETGARAPARAVRVLYYVRLYFILFLIVIFFYLEFELIIIFEFLILRIFDYKLIKKNCGKIFQTKLIIYCEP